MSDLLLLKHHKEMINSAECGMALVDEEGRFSYLNERFCEVIEYASLEMLGHKMADLIHNDDKNKELEMASLMEDGHRQKYKMMVRIVTKTNKIAWVALTVKPLHDGNTYEVTFKQIREVKDPGIQEMLNKIREELKASQIDRASLAERAKVFDDFIAFLRKYWWVILIAIMLLGAYLGPDKTVSMVKELI